MGPWRGERGFNIRVIEAPALDGPQPRYGTVVKQTGCPIEAVGERESGRAGERGVRRWGLVWGRKMAVVRQPGGHGRVGANREGDLA